MRLQEASGARQAAQEGRGARRERSAGRWGRPPVGDCKREVPGERCPERSVGVETDEILCFAQHDAREAIVSVEVRVRLA